MSGLNQKRHQNKREVSLKEEGQGTLDSIQIE
jgi:hypothetical protein